jgi:hypothetical protein
MVFARMELHVHVGGVRANGALHLHRHVVSTRTELRVRADGFYCPWIKLRLRKREALSTGKTTFAG